MLCLKTAALFQVLSSEIKRWQSRHALRAVLFVTCLFDAQTYLNNQENLVDIFALIDAVVTIKDAVQAAQEAGVLEHHEALADAFWASFHSAR